MMYRKIILFHIVSSLFIVCCSSKECTILKNAEVALFTDGGLKTMIVDNEEQDLNDVYKIKIQDQNIPILCKHGVQNLNKLDNLIIDSSGIKKIKPGAFENLPSLRTLVITNNNIEEIEDGVFNDLLIRKLNLSHNGISTIKPRSFENMINLEVLDLSSNQLKTFENNWFKYTPKLYRLNFMYNSIENIPENAFIDIIKSKQKKYDLELWFSHNSINTIHKRAFNKLEKIEDLWLNNNSLSNIDVEVFASIQAIQVLFLDNNYLTCFNDQFLKSLNVKELDIDGNPIDCICLEKIKEWSKYKGINVNSLRIRLNCTLQRLSSLKNSIL